MSRNPSARSRKKAEIDNQEALEEELDHQIKKANLLGFHFNSRQRQEEVLHERRGDQAIEQPDHRPAQEGKQGVEKAEGRTAGQQESSFFNSVRHQPAGRDQNRLSFCNW